ncbi:Actin-binding Rho-activating protein [Hondaea fermentalgiana]|uniref:Actin-binding Rho-activating protein n=1 Tax=Hondaea fermentalgiana TaxID=2315210 RepID=A0A2R5G7F1_9STRA|nr:Actin-binding Rho-activating protein [Hondaea fermentalgiana]|eukprot:GBG26982.1 Actin-binding Rho-activating protein [Hondaea fermentalgiana]
MSATRGSAERSRRGERRFGYRSSSSRRRAQEALEGAEREITKLVVVVVELGVDYHAKKADGSDEYAISFGELYEEYQHHAESVSGVLMGARRRGLVAHEGAGPLFHGRDDQVTVRLTRAGVVRAQSWRTKKHNARISMRLSTRMLPPGVLPSLDSTSLKRKANASSPSTTIYTVNSLRVSTPPLTDIDFDRFSRSKSASPSSASSTVSSNTASSTSISSARSSSSSSSSASYSSRISDGHWRKFDPRPPSARLQRATTAETGRQHITFSAYEAPKDHGQFGNSAKMSQTPHLKRFLSAPPPQRFNTYGYPDPKVALGGDTSKHLESSQSKLTTLRRSIARSFSGNRRSANSLLHRLSMQRSSSAPQDRAGSAAPAVAQDYDDYHEEEEEDDEEEADGVAVEIDEEEESSMAASRSNSSSLHEERASGSTRTGLCQAEASGSLAHVLEEAEETLDDIADASDDNESEMYEEEEELDFNDDYEEEVEEDNDVAEEPLVPRDRSGPSLLRTAAAVTDAQEPQHSSRSRASLRSRLSWRRRRQEGESPRNRYSRFRSSGADAEGPRWSQRRSRRRFNATQFADDDNNDARSSVDGDEYELPSCSDGVASMVSLAGSKLAESAAGFADGIAEGTNNWRISRRFSSASYASSSSERGYYTARSHAD